MRSSCLLIDDVRRDLVQRKRIEGMLKIDERVEIVVVVGRRKKKKEDGGAGKSFILGGATRARNHASAFVDNSNTAFLSGRPSRYSEFTFSYGRYELFTFYRIYTSSCLSLTIWSRRLSSTRARRNGMIYDGGVPDYQTDGSLITILGAYHCIDKGSGKLSCSFKMCAHQL